MIEVSVMLIEEVPLFEIMFKTVLFPIDESRESRQAVETVADVVKFHQSRFQVGLNHVSEHVAIGCQKNPSLPHFRRLLSVEGASKVLWVHHTCEQLEADAAEAQTWQSLPLDPPCCTRGALGTVIADFFGRASEKTVFCVLSWSVPELLWLFQ